MIPANELRVKLWVLVDGEPTKIENLEITNGEIVDPMYPEPIPLTPETLDRSGFTAKDEGLYDKTFKIYLQIDSHFGGFMFRYSIGPNSYGYAPLKYVHQLQNSFFALTGEELEIEL